MDYWDEAMQDDVSQIVQNGWLAQRPGRRRDGGTAGQRDSGTAGQRDSGTGGAKHGADPDATRGGAIFRSGCGVGGEAGETVRDEFTQMLEKREEERGNDI